MIADLQDAIAAINWANAQLPTLQERIIKWRRSKPYSIEIDTDSEPGKKLYRLVDLAPIDPIINAEAGAIIHSIRSSLDLLACALAARNGFPENRSTYFPIWKSEADFRDPKSPVLEKIKRLSKVDQDIIKNLRPYPGGHNMLAALHELDLTRKHRRLLRTVVMPRGITLSGLGGYTVLREWNSFNEETVLVATPASQPDGDVSVSLQVALSEANIASAGLEDCVGPIRELSRSTFEIVGLFI